MLKQPTQGYHYSMFLTGEGRHPFRVTRGLFYVWVALLPTQLTWHSWLDRLLLRGLRVDYLTLDLPLTELLLSLMVITYVWERWGLEKNALRPYGKLTPPLQLALWLSLWGLFQLTWIDLWEIQLWWILRVCVWLIGVHVVSRIGYQRRVLIWIFSGQLMLLLGLCFAQLVNSGSIQGGWYWLGERLHSLSTPGIATATWWGTIYLRPYATFAHPNVLAGFALALGLWVHHSHEEFIPRRTIPKALVLLAVSAAALLVILSQSQAAWVAWVLAIIGSGLGSLWPIKWRWVGLKVGWLGMMVGWLLIPVGMLWAESWVGPFATESLGLRNQLFQLYGQSGIESWLLGYGWHGFLGYLAQTPLITLTKAVLQPIHHTGWYLVSALGVGGAGLLAVWGFNQRWQGLERRRGLWVGVGIVVLITGAFDHYWITQVQCRMLLLFLLADAFRHPPHRTALRKASAPATPL